MPTSRSIPAKSAESSCLTQMTWSPTIPRRRSSWLVKAKWTRVGARNASPTTWRWRSGCRYLTMESLSTARLAVQSATRLLASSLIMAVSAAVVRGLIQVTRSTNPKSMKSSKWTLASRQYLALASDPPQKHTSIDSCQTQVALRLTYGFDSLIKLKMKD